MKKKLALTLLALYTLAAHATCPSWPTAERFTLNGDEVSDKQTGLVWRHCSEGQSWNGSTCTGSASTYTHEQALALAKAANSSNTTTGWRLPNVRELSSLIDEGCQNPAIDSTAFPATPSQHFWTSSPNVGGSSVAWGVSFGDGGVGNSSFRDSNGHVRLVRASQ